MSWRGPLGMFLGVFEQYKAAECTRPLKKSVSVLEKVVCHT